MNNLSWLIYFSDIIGSVITWMAVFGVIGCIGCIAAFIWWLVIGLNPKDKDIQDSATFQKTFRRLFIWLFVCGVVLSTLLPSRQAIILMAGSQLGERLMKSEEVKGVVDPGLDLVKTWIAKEAAKIKDGEKKKGE